MMWENVRFAGSNDLVWIIFEVLYLQSEESEDLSTERGFDEDLRFKF